MGGQVAEDAGRFRIAPVLGGPDVGLDSLLDGYLLIAASAGAADAHPGLQAAPETAPIVFNRVIGGVHAERRRKGGRGGDDRSSVI